MSTVTYLTGKWEEFNKQYEDWRKDESSKTMIYSFPEDEFVYTLDYVGLPSTSSHKKSVHMILVNDIQYVFLAEYSNQDTVISMRYSCTNPSNEKMTKWDEDVVKNEGYYYIVATRVNYFF